MTKQIFAIMAAATVIFAASAGFAANIQAARTDSSVTEAAESHGKMVGYCSKCNVYYSTADTKSMKMMDAEGHKLVMTQLSKVPKDAQLGHIGTKKHKG